MTAFPQNSIDCFTSNDFREICIRHDIEDDGAILFKLPGCFKNLDAEVSPA